MHAKLAAGCRCACVEAFLKSPQSAQRQFFPIFKIFSHIINVNPILISLYGQTTFSKFDFILRLFDAALGH